MNIQSAQALLFGALLTTLSLNLNAATAEADIDALLAQMSVEEKLGQLVQRAGGRSKALNSKLDDAELERVRGGAVGSYLHVAGAAPLRELQRVAVEESRLGIPLLFAMDVVHGYRTIFPVPLAMAATWSPQTVERAAQVAAVEASAAGLHWTFAPMIDIARDPRWGRVVEGAGADPYLGSVMAAAQVRGYQGSSLAHPHTLMATAKHFGAYGAAFGGRDYGSADVGPRQLQEVYLPPFRAAVDAGVASIMTAFNDIDGVPTTANSALLREQLRQQWGFDGIIVSDWNAIAELIAHGVADSRSSAAQLAMAAGVDVDMMSDVYADELAALSQNPAIMQQLNQAVRRVLMYKRALGLFDHPYQYHDVAREAALMLSPEHRRAALEAAIQAIVLLKNDGDILPIDPSGLDSIAVIGALATDQLSALGSWRAQGKAEDVVMLVDALRAALPQVRVGYAAGAAPQSEDLSGVPAALKLVQQSDLTILMVGEDFDRSGEARSMAEIGLPVSQQALAEQVLASGKPVVVVLANGRPLALPRLAEQAPALIEAWMLGVEAGPALTAVLLGERSPGGKLPIEFPRSSGAMPLAYGSRPSGRPADPDLSRDTVRYRDQPITPLFPFGHGLSYSQFSYAVPAQSAATMSAQQSLTLQFVLRNVGQRAADEVVQLYLRDPVATVARPMQDLRGFRRVHLAPGEAREIQFRLTPAQLALYASDGQWRAEAGAFEWMIASSAADIRLRGRFELSEDLLVDGPASALETVVEVSDTKADSAAESMGLVPAPHIRRYDAAVDAVIDVHAPLELLARGFEWSEGPAWAPEEQALYFNDVPQNTLYRWSAKAGLEVYLRPSGLAIEDSAGIFREPGTNGMVRAGPGRLLVADHGSRAVVELDLATQSKTVLADRYRGKRLNSPYDVVRRADGGIYFTDPPYGLRDLNDSPAKEQPHNGVYYRRADGQLLLIDADLSFPNGVALSPDQRTLYVANSDPQRPLWMRYQLNQDGLVLARGEFADASDLVAAGDPGLPDGMAVAASGELFATGPGGVLIFSPQGQRLGRIETGTAIANCAFGDQGQSLYLTADSLLIRVSTLVRGLDF